MTKDDLEAIRQRAEAATEGYWGADDSEWPGNGNLRYWINTHWDGVAAAVTKEDAEFIAHARQDIPALLDHIAELQGKIDLYESYAQEYDYYAILNEMGDENADDR
ncbi:MULTISPECIES: hypothetical protein [Bacillus]|uniref:hypothetical protein n=1 Tax=Bacillus TaxID=1386 RepID=UPI00119D78B5|nr:MULTISPECIES: hypothetical protein [Bacillus]MDQ9094253.1 hypothetical protein [Bacillus licheniformis]MDU0071687.1 hypothetical protein [Bacillus sp. IG6]MEC0478588.1 hypothetical protein [Bacillus licheniformis]MEC0490102.1 hypothetical protein [Bacillus licheniformis]MED8021332.1 hypothetical protein [Bacillus glycinifermentans]